MTNRRRIPNMQAFSKIEKPRKSPKVYTSLLSNKLARALYKAY